MRNSFIERFCFLPPETLKSMKKQERKREVITNSIIMDLNCVHIYCELLNLEIKNKY